MMTTSVEILAPAGGVASLKAAVNAGADAVYMGGTSFGARAYAENFKEEELLSAIDYVHVHGKKLYLTVNTLVKDSEMKSLYEYLVPCYERGLDAVIVQDVGVMEFIRRYFPELPIHVSTQATVTGSFGAEFFKGLGARRVIPARELSLEEIRKIRRDTGLEVECFVHGALCYCYSGQCLLSSLIGGRSGNRGQCAQPCRLPYMPEGGRYQDILSLKDLCAIDLIPELIEAGVDSFKIEGRMKQPDYVRTVVGMYRKYTDLYREKGAKGFKVEEGDRKLLQGIYTRRGYTKGYYKQHNGKDMISLNRPEGRQREKIPASDTNLQEKINGKLILSIGEPVKLYVESGGFFAKVEGAVVQKSVSRPLDTGRIDKQMRKTGNTEFVFETLDIFADRDIFLPMQALNELRREGILKLKEAVISASYRGKPERYEPDVPKPLTKDEDAGRKPELSVLVSEEGHFKRAFGDHRVDTVYIESELALDIGAFKDRGEQKLFLAMPYIFRDGTVRMFEKLYTWIAGSFDGVLVRSFEAYQWLRSRGYSGKIRSDCGLYVWNGRSREVLKSAGISRFTAPAELNCRELSELGLSSGCLVAYGRQPVMISAGCVRKNTKGCRREDGRLILTDRKKNDFIVKNNCRYCYNVMYNCQPLMLISRQEDVKRLNAAELRLDFLDETADQMDRIVDLYRDCFKNDMSVKVPDIRYTNGHFKRGVK